MGVSKNSIRKILLIVLVAPIFVYCRQVNNNESTKSAHGLALANEIKTESSDNLILSKEKTDSLRNPNSNYYLFDLEPKQYAKLILNDSIRPSDNLSTFRLLDSLEAKSYEDRKFYFKVCSNIMTKSDGALSEVVGEMALLYAENNIKEFLGFIETLTDNEVEKWGFFLCGEMLISSDTPREDAERFYNKLKQESSETNKEKIEKLYKIMVQMIENNII